jgi:hypothetical protein
MGKDEFRIISALDFILIIVECGTKGGSSEERKMDEY